MITALLLVSRFGVGSFVVGLAPQTVAPVIFVFGGAQGVAGNMRADERGASLR